MNNTYTIYNLSTGIIQGYRVCSVQDIGYNTPSGCSYIEGKVEPVDQYKIDIDTKSPIPYVIPVSVEKLKTDKLAQIKNIRDSIIIGGFEWVGKKFDSDQTSQTKLLGLYMSAIGSPALFPMSWRLSDNSWLSISTTDAIDVWNAFQTKQQAAFANFAKHEAAVNALTSVMQVQSYDITTGW